MKIFRLTANCKKGDRWANFEVDQEIGPKETAHYKNIDEGHRHYCKYNFYRYKILYEELSSESKGIIDIYLKDEIKYYNYIFKEI